MNNYAAITRIIFSCIFIDTRKRLDAIKLKSQSRIPQRHGIGEDEEMFGIEGGIIRR